MSKCGAVYFGICVPAIRMNLLPPSSERRAYPEERSSMFLRNVSTRPPNHTTSHSHRQRTFVFAVLSEERLNHLAWSPSVAVVSG